MCFIQTRSAMSLQPARRTALDHPFVHKLAVAHAKKAHHRLLTVHNLELEEAGILVIGGLHPVLVKQTGMAQSLGVARASVRDVRWAGLVRRAALGVAEWADSLVVVLVRSNDEVDAVSASSVSWSAENGDARIPCGRENAPEEERFESLSQVLLAPRRPVQVAGLVERAVTNDNDPVHLQVLVCLAKVGFEPAKLVTKATAATADCQGVWRGRGAGVVRLGVDRDEVGALHGEGVPHVVAAAGAGLG